MMAIPMVWDWAEANPFYDDCTPLRNAADSVAAVVEKIIESKIPPGSVTCTDARHNPYPDGFFSMIFSDPPYYDSIPYANLSDFFYIWNRKILKHKYPDIYLEKESPKNTEITQLAERNKAYRHKTKEYFEEGVRLSFEDSKRACNPFGVACFVFAHKTTSGWESFLQGVLGAGWRVTASWPIDTEMSTRFKAIGTASLASSIHLICRPKPQQEEENIGDWRDVLEELPNRIRYWLPHLAEHGIVGADAIFACLGPALEIYSKYSTVEKANGDKVELNEYLEQVWAAVSKEALSNVVADADLSGFETDARVSAMWLWTVVAPAVASNVEGEENVEKNKPTGFTLEFDAARKIAQGLGADLDELESIITIEKDEATLLPVAQRTEFLFGKGESAPESAKGRKKKNSNQLDMFSELIEDGASEDVWEEKTVSKPGETVLDRVHQAMILFASGRGEALKRFLVDDGVGQDPGLWKLAQAFSALYPPGTQEKRWVDGVLARKKGLGL